MMRVSCLSVVSALCVLLYLTLLAPACVLGALPTTVESQADWLADRYAGVVELAYERLSAESIQVTRAEMANGLRSVIAAPLSRQQLRELDEWVVTKAVPAGDLTPPELELHRWVGLALDAVRLYLSRPPMAPELHRAIMAQAGVVFDALRRELAAQFLGLIPDVETSAAAGVFGDTFLVSAAATSLVSPFMKRLFTSAEMEMLVQYARDAAVGVRADWDNALARAPEEGRAAYTAWVAQFGYFGRAAAQTQYKILATSYILPAVLTEAEQRAVVDAYAEDRAAARAAAETGGQR